MKKTILFLILAAALVMTVSGAAPVQDSLHLTIDVQDANNDSLTGTFNFQFNITTQTDCSSPFFTNTTSLTTDQHGRISYYLNATNLGFKDQYYLCVYRNGALVENIKLARETERNISEFNTNSSDKWDNLDSPPASWSSTYNATYAANIGNASWNQSLANTLYSDIKWGYNMTTPFTNWLSTFVYDYNMTIPANSYTDSVNQSTASWINSIFLKITDMFTKSEITNMILGNWTDLETRKLNVTDQRFNDTTQINNLNNVTIARIGNCTAGQVVVNITNSGVQCITPSSSITNIFDQVLNTTSNVSFNNLTLTQSAGIAPMYVTSTTKVTNFNADLLDGYHIGTIGGAIPILNVSNTWNATQTIGGINKLQLKDANTYIGAISPTSGALTISATQSIVLSAPAVSFSQATLTSASNTNQIAISPSGASNSERTYFSEVFTGTTSAANNTMWTTALSANGAMMVEANIVATNINSYATNSYTLRNTYVNTGASAALVGTAFREINEQTASWDAYLMTNGANVNITITGQASTQIQWVALIKMVRIDIPIA